MELDLAQLRALAAAVQHGTFDAAARALHITPSAVSQRIKALEIAAGRVLLVRSKPVAVTDAGSGILRLARQIDALSADATRALEPDSAHPVTVPLAVNADSLATWVLPALAAMPSGIVFELHRADQEHTTRLLRDGTVMAAITAEAEPVQGCTVTRLGRMIYRATAAPAFAERWFAEGATADALALAPVVVFDRDDRLQHRYLRARSRRALHPPQHQVPGSTDFVEAVRLGLGWGMLPDQQADPLGAQLVRLEGEPIEVPLYWQQWSLRTPSLDAVAAAVAEAASGALV
ncbi:LysR family transcriptional regulator ArgP [Microbacteriaceae bacterium VKM Ac-2855]|nr:LysR family transcriptional regulator ArgP [Microbacteriaceae bacterium VKM Ac-2855]